MTEDDLKMVEALVQHMGQKIDQVAETVTTPMGQIMVEELRASYTRLRSIVLRDKSNHDLPGSPVSYQAPAPSSFVHSPASSVSTLPTAGTSPAVSSPGPSDAAVPKKVLFLIDDDKDAQKVLSYMFERKSPFRVVSHTDPLKAWEEIKVNPPDLILMDLMMPGISGLDLLKNIRQIPVLSHIKILIGSSKSFDKDRIEVLKAGANDFIAKPYNFTELLLRLNKLAS